MATETVSRPAAEFPLLVTHDPAELTLGLFRRAAGKLTENDLINLLNCQEDAKQNLRQLAKVCASVGGLVRAEAVNESEAAQGSSVKPMRSGSFQSADDVPDLLFALGGMVEQSLALLEIANQAEIELEIRERSAAAAAKRARRG